MSLSDPERDLTTAAAPEPEVHTPEEWARLLAPPPPPPAGAMTLEEYNALVARNMAFEADVARIDAEHRARLQAASDAYDEATTEHARAFDAAHAASVEQRDREVEEARAKRDAP